MKLREHKGDAIDLSEQEMEQMSPVDQQFWHRIQELARYGQPYSSSRGRTKIDHP